MTNDIVKAIISTIILWACIYAFECAALLPPRKKEEADHNNESFKKGRMK